MNLASSKNTYSEDKITENDNVLEGDISNTSDEESHEIDHLNYLNVLNGVKLDCPHCFKKFKGKEVWKIHIRNCHGKFVQTNSTCNLEDLCDNSSSNYFDKAEMKEGSFPFEDNKSKNVSNNSFLVCKLCNDLFNSVEEYNIHIETHVHDDSQQNFDDSSEHSDGIVYHSKKNSSDLKDDSGSSAFLHDYIKSSDCYSSFSNVTTKNKIFIKNDMFEKQSSLNMDSNFEQENKNDSHQSVSIFICKLCGLKFNSRMSFILHKEDHLKPPESPSLSKNNSIIISSREVFFCCEICGEKFKTNRDCSEHFKIHNINKCNICKKEFPSDLKLKEHTVVHEAQVKSDQCEFCLLRFSHNESLESHLSDAHQDIKTLKNCPLCHKRCASSYAVKRHVLKCHLIPVLQQEIRENYALGSDLMDNMKSVGVVTIQDEVRNSNSDLLTESGLKEKQSLLPILICDICGFTTKDKIDMVKHRDIHSLDLISCELCNRKVGGDDELKTHLMQEHGIESGAANCPHCLADYDNLKKHMTEMHGQIYSNLVCNICGEMFFNKKSLTKHLRDTHLMGSSNLQQFKVIDFSVLNSSNDVSIDYENELSVALKTIENKVEVHNVRSKCDICDLMLYKEEFDNHKQEHLTVCHICKKNCQTKSDLKTHLEKHSEETQNTPCPFCSDKLHDKTHLLQHILSVHPDKNQSFCQLCGKHFLQRSLYLKHLNSKHSIDKTCNICGKHFTSLNLYTFHKEYSHRTNMACSYCEKVCKDIKQLKNHEGIHRKYDGKIFICNECGKQFKTPSGLKFHTISHTGKYPYVCEFCGRGFTSFYGLSEHRASHTGDVRYCCDICGKSFRLYDTYHRHRRQHDNPFPAKCKDCGKRFRNASRVAEHRRKTHTGERPYCCPYCPMTFNVSSSYRLHLCIHTKVFPYNCKICSRGFTTRLKYGNHLASKHDDFSIVLNKNPNYKNKCVPDINNAIS